MIRSLALLQYAVNVFPLAVTVKVLVQPVARFNAVQAAEAVPPLDNGVRPIAQPRLVVESVASTFVAPDAASAHAYEIVGYATNPGVCIINLCIRKELK